jgi:hypothetical protein
MMKNSAAFAFAALLATSSLAQAAEGPFNPQKFSGYIRGYFTNSTYSNTSQGWDGYDPWNGWGEEVVLNWHLPNGTDLQGEIRHWLADSSLDDQYKVHDTLAAIHWSKRNSKFLYGAYGGARRASTYYSTRPDYDILFGVEGQGYLTDEITVSGQLGALKTISAYYKPKPAWMEFAQLSGRYFLWDNTKFEAGGSYFYSNRLGETSDEDARMWNYNLEVEHRFHATPVSVFADYDWWDHSDGIDTEGGDHTWKLGIKVALGTSSLRDEDRHGATLKVVNFEPLTWLKLDGW